MTGHTLESAAAWLRQAIAPRAQALDTDTAALALALADLAQQGLLGLKVPEVRGGAGWSGPDFLAWQRAIARTSGALAFLQAQHQSACAVASVSPNPIVQSQWLPRLAAGRCTSGIAFSHLRRPGPVLAGVKVPGGWRLDGEAPWVTGHGLFSHCTTAAVVPEQDGTLFALHPFESGRGLTVGPVLALAALTAANTVTLTFDDVFIPDDRVVAVAPSDWVSAKDRRSVAAQGMLALGCAYGALDTLAGHQAQAALLDEAGRLQPALLALVDAVDRYDEALALRAQVIAFMGRCAHAAVARAAGSASLAGHPAQRIWREALVFTVLSQSPDVREATLDALSE